MLKTLREAGVASYRDKTVSISFGAWKPVTASPADEEDPAPAPLPTDAATLALALSQGKQ